MSSMKILMTGATGFIGGRLGEELVKAGHSLVVVTRNSAKARAELNYKADLVECDLNTTPLPAESFFGVNAVINLTGESIDGRWTSAKKKKIRDSRVLSARHLLANCPANLSTIITASAQGIYGDRGDETLTELSPTGKGFLAEVCLAWEAEFRNQSQRVVILRFGMVLGKGGGALQKLIPLFKKNLGAPLGKGNQWVSYVSLMDLVAVIGEALINPAYIGVINVANNNPVTSAEFSKTLCKSLKVWCLPHVPAAVLRIMLGEMSELVLSSVRLKPEKLNKLGFKFQYESLEKIFDTL